MGFVKRHKILCIVLGIVVVLAAVAGVWAYRVYRTVAGPAFAQADASQMQQPQAPTGAQTVSLGYLSEVIMLGAPSGTSTYNEIPVGWDDAWFSRPSSEFNYGLAQFSIAASAMANGESMSHSDEVDFDICERTLGPLGFTDIDTSSYEGSTYAADEIEHIIEGRTDDVAFVLAHKTLPAVGGAAPCELVLLSIRGTYGSEWLSNFKVELGGGEYSIDEHAGYLATTGGVLESLTGYCSDHGIDLGASKLLITGHSRGASVAGTLAAMIADLDKADGNGLVGGPESVYAYCFATSPNTKSERAHDPLYAGIFNILDPTDLVPLVPLAEWGFTYWGRVGMLPDTEAAGFTGLFDDMNRVRAHNTGYIGIKPYHEGDVNLAAALHDDIAEIVPTVDGMGDPSKLARAVGVVSEYDMVRILASHCPDTYIAWLQTLAAGDIAWE